VSSSAIRSAIVTVLATVPDIGRVQPYERYAKDQQKLKEFYFSEDHDSIRGCHVRRLSVSRTGRIDDEVEHTRWRILLLMAISDAEESEIAFDELIDRIASTFAAEDGLLETVDQCSVPADGGGSADAGIQLDDSGPAMFGGVLCHAARLTLNTIRYLEPNP
jgi:hypothetical protein